MTQCETVYKLRCLFVRSSRIYENPFVGYGNKYIRDVSSYEARESEDVSDGRCRVRAWSRDLVIWFGRMMSAMLSRHSQSVGNGAIGRET